MKIRNGFVSNSSSTSFLVGCKNKNDNVIPIRYIIDMDDCSFIRKFNTFDEFNKWFRDRYTWEAKEVIDEKIIKAKEVFDNGGVVYNFAVSNDGGDMERSIAYNGYKILKFDDGIFPLHDFEGI